MSVNKKNVQFKNIQSTMVEKMHKVYLVATLAQTHTPAHAHMRVHTHTYTQYTNTHTHTHTHTHSD